MLQLHKLPVMLLLFITLVTRAQVTDDFSDGNFTAFPQWLGDEAKFTVNASFQLQLNTTLATPAYLAVPVTITAKSAMEWRFWIKLGFSPSSLNNARIYLSADQQNLTAALNGYYLQFGEASAMDKMELFRQEGIDAVSICRGKTSIAKSVEMRVKVIRDTAGNWSLFADSTGGTNFLPEATGNDSAYYNINYAGIVCNYTSSNASKFYMDDFYVGPQVIDKEAPLIDSVVLSLPYQLIVYFNEAVDKNSAQTITNYKVDNNIGVPAQAILSGGDNKCVILNFPNKWKSGINYNLTVNNVRDIATNTLTAVTFPFYYYITQAFDVVINEVMPDPTTGCVDFVEIYNRSNQPVALNQLFLCSMDTIKNILVQQKQISTKKQWLLPGNYLLLSTHAAAVKQCYPVQNQTSFLDMPAMPAMNIDGDVVVIADSAQHVIDKLIYTNSMHFPLLPHTKGVSLERIDYNRPTADKTNWHSAAAQVGYGTPGYQNSQYLTNNLNNEVSVVPEIFSPDNDGYHDVVTIGYNFNAVGNMATINIVDKDGRLVKSLVRNELLAASGAFSWDGTTDNLEKARSGIYVFYIELFDTTGKVKQFKKAVVLAIK